MKYNLNNKQFVTIGNEHGLSSSETVFHYSQSGEIITGQYGGGEIVEGCFVGRFTSPDRIELLFQCVTKTSKLLAGKSSGQISTSASGKLHLSFDWQWLHGDEGGGTSSYVERGMMG
ncbi:MAG: hypothetical protein HZB47_13680 [Nitrosomonadales bacterium]|nr:hypothetical protein [Nitrosomonadales bacterium]